MKEISAIIVFFITHLLPYQVSAIENTICFAQAGFLGICMQPSGCPSGKLYMSQLCAYSEMCCCLKEETPQFLDIRSAKPKKNTPKKDLARNRIVRTTPSSTTPSIESLPYLRIRGCGVKRTLTDFVIGGRNANNWPWMASIFIRPRGARVSRFNCGGTVISKKYILTAAHCVDDGSPNLPTSRVTVRVGGLTLAGDGQEYQVKSIKKHESYRRNVHYYDIAVLELKEDITSKAVVPVCLPSQGMYFSNFYRRNGTVIGWGLTLDGRRSPILQEAVVPIVSNNRCNSRYSRLGTLSLPRGITDTLICAGTDDGSRDSCEGDSGGPLLVSDKSSKWNVIGVVSFGYGCAEPDYPGVYTRVTKYLQWLKDNTDINDT